MDWNVQAFVDNARSHVAETLRKQSLRAAEDVAQEVLPLFYQTIAGWQNHTVEFVHRVDFYDSDEDDAVISIYVTPVGTDVWLWDLINLGEEETRFIYAKEENELGMAIFPYTPGSTPEGGLLSAAGVRAKYPNKNRRFVVPHQVKARSYREQIANIMWDEDMIGIAMRKHLRAWGTYL
jgi:hypothetical protein